MFAFDVSNWSGEFTREQAAALRDRFRKAIVGCQEPSIAIEQIASCRTACIEVELYVQLYFGVHHDRELDKLGQVVLEMDVPKSTRIWLAAEDTLAGIGPNLVDCWLWSAIDNASGRGFSNLGVYTRRDWWSEYMDDSSRYAKMGFPLWVAQYDDQPVIKPEDSFAQWTPEMKQYTPNTVVAGVTVDLNVY